MAHFHAVVWIDHQKATVWHFTPTEQQSTVVHAHGQHQRVHSRKSAHGGQRAGAAHVFFEEVAQALAGAREVLIIGPAQSKHEFVKFLGGKHAALRQAVVAVENADHPSDAEVLAYARKHFDAIDRMLAT